MAESAASHNASKNVFLKKCCDVYEMLDAVSLRCVDAPWPQSTIYLRKSQETNFLFYDIRPPYDEQWLSHWVPPGLPLQALGDRIMRLRMYQVGSTYRAGLNLFGVVESVNESALWSSENTHNLRPEILTLDGQYLQRNRLDGSFWSVDDYCVDAATPPLGPFAVLRKCEWNECVWKCCGRGELLASDGRRPVPCRPDPRGWWSPSNSSQPALSRLGARLRSRAIVFRDPSFRIHHNPSPRLLTKEYLSRINDQDIFSYKFFPCADFYRDESGRLSEVVGYLYYPRYANAAHKLTRHLSFVTVLLLAAALGSLACTPRMRHSAHGRALACHASCLLLFNLTLVLYYLTISDEVDGQFYFPEQFQRPCKAFGFTAYFLLTAANCWLTAVCINMARGFRKYRPAGALVERRYFRQMSVAAWSVAGALSVACIAVFLSASDKAESFTNVYFKVYLPIWYRPSLMETRTCYSEQTRTDFSQVQETGVAFYSEASVKWGTLLFFYAPSAALVLMNVVALALTARRVQYLRRGNSLLAEAGDSTGTSDPQGIVVYLKLLLSAGLLEMLAEVLAWGLTKYRLGECKDCTYNANYLYNGDHTFVYRAVGYCGDLLRAAIVLWLCAPDRRALRAFWSRLRGKAGAQKGADGVAPMASST